MKNELEELTSEDLANYNLYLKRMTDSMSKSTKGMIPFMAREAHNILDVGCGSGITLSALSKANPSARLTGVDLNMEAIKRLRALDTDWTLYHKNFLDLKKGGYDMIIFSSILHEVSSYHTDPQKRFSSVPILESFIKSNELLTDDGCILLRDGLLVPDSEKDNQLIVTFDNPEDSQWLYRFREDFKGFDNIPCNKDILSSYQNEYLVSERFLKEFLYTFTWGEASYHREINERFGILTRDEWVNLLKEAGFSIEILVESQEQYEQFLSKKVRITDLCGNKYEYPFMSILIKGRKVKSLKK